MIIAKVTLRNLAAHKLRLALTAVAVLLGVSFVSGALILTDTMSKQFDDIFAKVGRGVAVDVRGKTVVDAGGDEQAAAALPVPGSVLDTVRRVDGVKDPVGHVFGYAAVVGKDGKLVGPQQQGPPQMGVNWVPGGDYVLKTGRAPAGPAEVAIDENTAGKAGYRIGDAARVLAQGPPQRMTVVGIVGTGNLAGATLTAFDTATAQRLLVKPGYFTDISMRSTGPGETELRDRVARVLPANMEAITGTKLRDDAKSDVAQVLSFIRYFLLIFALISIFVGTFIIFNTFSMLVAQRTRELALLRAVGAARKQVTRAVLGEAIGVGVVGSTLGLAVGAGLAMALHAKSGIAGSGGLVFTATPVIWSYAVGIVVTVVSAYFPARRAAKIPPVAAMRDDVALPQRSLRIRLGSGSVLTLAGAALMGLGLADALGGNPLIPIGIGAFLVFLGVAMLAPAISRPVVRVLSAPFPWLFRTPGRLAQQNALRNPRRTAATAAALMIGLALVTTVNVMGSSMSASIDKALADQFGADYMVMAENRSGFGQDVVAAIAGTSGVTRATAYYAGNVNIGGKRAAYVAGDTAGLASASRIKMISGDTSLGADGILVDEDTAKALAWTVGGTVHAQFPDGGSQPLRIAGIYAKNQLLGPRVLPLSLYTAHTAKPQASLVLVSADTPGAATKAAIERSVRDYPNLKVRDQTDVKKQARQQIDQVVSLVTMLLTMAIIIAAVGVINTLALSVIERTREIGLLRAVGTSRRQLRRMIRLESVVIAVFGAVLGIAVGVAFGAAIQHALAGQGLNVLDIPVTTIVVYLVLAALIGMLAALWPAWRAGRMDVLKAIATE